MATCNDPPVLLDALKSNWESTDERKVSESDAKIAVVERVSKDDEQSLELDIYDLDDSDFEEEDNANGEEEECEYDEDEEEYVCYDVDEEEEEEEIDPCPPDEDYDPDRPDIDRNLFLFHPSDESFQESNLEERRKRRFLIGTHSFLDLADQHLENALDPYPPPPPIEEQEEEDEEPPEEIEVEEDEDEEGEDEEEDGMLEEEEGQVKKRRVCITLREEKDNYKELCKKMGIHPDPRIMRSLRGTVMDLRGMGMNSKEVAAVCALLETNQHVQYLILAGNTIGLNPGGLALAQLITENQIICGYDLAGTEILEAFDIVCDALAENPAILHLNFSKNELEDIDMPSIKRILQGAPKLQTLDLSANLIKDDGLKRIGQGLLEKIEDPSMESINVSHNKIRGEKQAAVFFTACSQLTTFKDIKLKRNFIGDDGGKGVSRMLANNPTIECLDMSFNLMQEASAAAIGKSLGRQERRNLKTLQLEINRWHQLEGTAVLKSLGNQAIEMPIELVDFGMMLDIHKEFIDAKEKAITVHPDLKIIHGLTFGMDHAPGPDHKTLLMKRADVVCKSFETPFVMLMEELAKEKHELTSKEFKKFIKQCNLYKDKSLTESFEKTFETVDGNVDAAAILESFDTVYPGLRVIPEPQEDDEEEEMEETPTKKKKKGKGGKGKGKGAAGGKGKKK